MSIVFSLREQRGQLRSLLLISLLGKIGLSSVKTPEENIRYFAQADTESPLGFPAAIFHFVHLLEAQGVHRINPDGAPRRKIAGRERRRREQDRDAEENKWIARVHPIK